MPTRANEAGGNGGHPTGSELAAFGLGRLARTVAEQIERHVAGCPACCRALEVVPDDDFLHSLRTLPPASPSATAADGVGDTRTGPAAVPPELAGHPKYEIEEVLGYGGMGVVFRARHRLMNRAVALKVINQRFVENPTALERFRREMRAAAALAHPNVVTAFDAEPVGDLHVLAMEYVEGISLSDLVERDGPLPVAEACECVRQAALGLQHAFEHGVVHRDLKPHNLVRSRSGVVKILDFGLAGFAREALPLDPAPPAGDSPPSGALTATNVVLGTPAYLAPEQAADPRSADVRSDLYGLGCTLFFLLTGRPPFPGATVSAILHDHAEKPAPLEELAGRVPAGLVRILERLLDKDPARRYQTPGMVAEALAPFARACPSRGRLGRAVVAALLLAALGGVGVWVAARAGRGPGKGPGNTRPADDTPGLVSRLDSEGKGVLTASVSADGRRLLSGNADSTLRLWDLKTRQEQFWIDDRGQKVPWIKALTGGGACADLSPDGRLALAWSHPINEDGTLRLWDLESRQELHRWDGHEGGVAQGVFTPDGRRALTVGRDRLGRLWEWDSKRIREIQILKGHEGRVLCAAVSPDGRRAATGGSDATVRLWDLKDGRELRCLRGHAGNVECVAFTPDGHVVSGGHDTTVRLWDAETGEERRRMEGHNFLVQALSVSPDGKQVLAAEGPEFFRSAWTKGSDHGVRLWDLETGRLVDRFGGIPGGLGTVAFVPGGRLAVWGGPHESALRLWRLPAEAEPKPEGPGQERRFDAPGVGILSVAFSPDGKRLVGAGTDHTLWLWDVPTAQEEPLFRGGTGGDTIWVTSAVFSPDGSRLLSGESDGSVCLWDAVKGTLLWRGEGHQDGVWAVAFANEGKWGVSVSEDHTVRVWDLAKGHEERRMLGHTDRVRALAVDPGGKRAWSGGQDGTVCAWDLDEQKKLWSQTLPAEPIHALVLSPDGKTLLGACGKVLRLWDAADGKERGFLPRAPQGRAEAGEADGVAFTPDGKRALSVGLDEMLRVWDLERGEEVIAFKVNSVPRGVAASPDGRHAACGSRRGGGVYLWRLP